MSTPFHIEVDEVKHFHGYEGVMPTDTPCDHECEHWGQSVIAWGPDVAHYELVACDGGDDACGCVTWVDGREQQARDRGESAAFWIERRRWCVPNEDVRTPR